MAAAKPRNPCSLPPHRSDRTRNCKPQHQSNKKPHLQYIYTHTHTHCFGALEIFSLVIGCDYSSSETQSLCIKMFPPFLCGVNICAIQPPTGQKPETDHQHTHTQKSEVGRSALLANSLSPSAAQCDQQFLFQHCVCGNEADWCHNKAVNNLSGRHLKGEVDQLN